MANIPSDPLFASQWHLQNIIPTELDLNVVDVWDDYTGAGVNVAIIDEGFETTHPDLIANYAEDRDWDFENGDNDPSSGGSAETHGTAVAGIIGATANNDRGGVGVAYGSTIFGFKVGRYLNDAQIQSVTAAINTTSYNLPQAKPFPTDIINLSIGSQARNPNYFDQVLDPTVMAKLNLAIDTAVAVGRPTKKDNLGTILVKGAGNGREENYDTNSSSWNANPHTISVAAVDRDGFVSNYSTHGASLLISGFGTQFEVVTTDVTGTRGYDPSDYTTTQGFAGTSAAAPMVSGIIALMLEANSQLGWRDVQEILAYSARHVGSDVGTAPARDEEYAWSFNGANNWNGGGLHFSNDYGFGLVDGKAAVRLAESWNGPPQTTANQVSESQDFVSRSKKFRGTLRGNGRFSSFKQSIDRDIDIESVEVDVSFARWDDLGDLEIRLISPKGSSSILINQIGENDNTTDGGFGAGRWKFYSSAFRGESTVGEWKLQFVDVDSKTSAIQLIDADITFSGQAASSDDTYIFTNEFSDYSNGEFGHDNIIGDGIGIDTVNAAAVDTMVRADLLNQNGTIDGVGVRFSNNVQNVIGGDGNDQLVGNNDDNRLIGMRGNDSLIGKLGDDYLNGTHYGAQGNGEIDTLLSDSNQDQDTFVLGESKNGIGRVFYKGSGDDDYAIIRGFSINGNTDLIQLVGVSSHYSTANVSINNLSGTGIYSAEDLIGLVIDVDSASLSLSNANQFTYV